MKKITIGIITLLIFVSFAPSISGTTKKLNNPLITTVDEESYSIELHVFDKSEKKQHDIVLQKYDAERIIDVLEELKHKIVYEPKSEETQNLKIEFVNLLDANGLIPSGLSKSYILSLLNPAWLKNKQRSPYERPRNTLLTNIIPSIKEGIVKFQSIFKNRIGHTIFTKIRGNSPPYTDSASATFCSISSGGNGIILPLFLLPRPRGIATWSAPSAVTLVGELITADGFVAKDAQVGTALGFTGIGLTYALPGYTAYGFLGYALYTKVSAETIEFFGPPNQKPIISDENPVNGESDVPISLSQLSFRISDPDGERMDYTVTTDPDIGSDSGSNKQNGVYNIPISGLEVDKFYKWTVEVTDGKDTTKKQFSFFTESRPPFNPFDEGWEYRKEITIDHTKVTGSLTNFPVLLSSTDIDLRDKAQNDGDDILFMDGTGVANKLYHEIEYFDDSTGEIIAWIKIPSISSTTDTNFYIYYRNPSSDNQEIPYLVWDTNYVAVYHMDGNSHSNIVDSTFYNHNVVDYQGNPQFQKTGKVSYCVDFDDDSLNIDDSDLLSFTDDSNNDMPMTLEAWVKCDSVSTVSLPILSKYGPDGDEWLIYKAGQDFGKLYLYDQSSGGAITRCTESALNVDNTGWNYLSSSYIGDEKGTGISFVLDGNFEEGEQFTGPAYSGMENSNGKMRIGSYYDRNGGDWYYWQGLVDEVRISNIARSESWLKTSYNTMNDPSSFLNIGPEEI